MTEGMSKDDEKSDCGDSPISAEAHEVRQGERNALDTVLSHVNTTSVLAETHAPFEPLEPFDDSCLGPYVRLPARASNPSREPRATVYINASVHQCVETSRETVTERGRGHTRTDGREYVGSKWSYLSKFAWIHRQKAGHRRTSEGIGEWCEERRQRITKLNQYLASTNDSSRGRRLENSLR